MSWLDGLVEQNEALSQDDRLERTADKLKPGFFTGALDVVGPNLLRGGIEAGAAVESGFSSLWQGGLDLAASALLPEPKFGGTPNVTSAEESSQETLGQGVGEMAKDYRPDPTEVGVAGQIIGEAAAILPRTIVGAALGGPVGAAAAAGGPAGYSRKRTAMEEGIDEPTATLLGLTEGVVTGVGAAIPAAGFAKTLTGDAVLAVGANVGLGMAHRGVSAELLEGGGYHAQAAQYRALDATAIATDAILGAAFFGIGRATMRRPTTEQISAALADRNAQHADIDTAPGLPVNPRSAVAHQDALRSAIDSINRGEPVVLPDSIHSAEFLRTAEDISPIVPGRTELLEAAKKGVIPSIRKQLKKEIADDLPNAKELSDELALVQKKIDDLSEIKSPRKFDRLDTEIAGRNKSNEEVARLTQQKADLEQQLQRNAVANTARAELEALSRGEIPERFGSKLEAQTTKMSAGFQRKPLSSAVAEASRPMSPRRVNERAAREEIDALVRDHEATLPREPVPAPKADLPTSGKPVDAQPSAKDASSGAKDAATAPKDANKPADNAEPPELRLLRDAVSRNPEVVVNSGFDADGAPLKAKASDVLAEIEAEHRTGVRESQSFMAAITCLLR